MLSVIIEGKERFLGNNQPFLLTEPKKMKGVYGDFPNQPMYTRSQWKPKTMRRFVPEILDQDGIGACNAFCTVMCCHVRRNIDGLPYRCLSPGYLYGNINGGRDEGSNLEDALNWMKDHGTCYKETVGMLDWRSRPSAAKEEAKSNIILEAYWCPTFDHLASAVLSDFACNTGIWWGDYDKPDSNGWLPGSARGNRGGHSIPAIGIFPQPGGSTRWGYETANSWGTNFGDNGFCKIPESRVTSDGMSAGMWAICATSVPEVPQDLPAPTE